MASFITHKKMPKNYEVILTSDWHVGSKGFDSAAADHILDRLHVEKNTFMIFNGDSIEGKKIDSPHFAPKTLRQHQLSIQEQIEYVADMWKPIAKKILAVNYGNHDMYIYNDWDCVKSLCDTLKIPHVRGGYQTWVDLNGLRVFCYHGKASMTKGAKDPIQREANQRAWLKRALESLASNCHVMLMGHVHALLVQAPLMHYGLLAEKGKLKAEYFQSPVSQVTTENGTFEFVPADARWYGCTGTLRQSIGEDYIDYAEVAGYGPAPIGYLNMSVRNGRVADIKTVVQVEKPL